MSDATAPSIGVIETDAFCDGCGFNLHAQAVWRDERLGLPIARCPECGRHHAAGTRTTPGNAWLRRAALAGLVAWLALQVAFVVSLVGGFVAVHVLANETLATDGYVTADGQPILAQRDDAGGVRYGIDVRDAPLDLAAGDVRYGKRLAPWLAGRRPSATGDDFRYATPAEAAVTSALLAIAIVGAASVLASLSWFWRRGAMWLWLAVPIGATLAVFALIWQNAPSPGGPFSNGFPRVAPNLELRLAAYVGVATTLAMAFGLAVGRPVARLAVSVFMPPRSRQLFTFLWHCDGKAMPAPSRKASA